jgi:hypothetical protein
MYGFFFKYKIKTPFFFRMAVFFSLRGEGRGATCSNAFAHAAQFAMHKTALLLDL